MIHFRPKVIMDDYVLMTKDELYMIGGVALLLTFFVIVFIVMILYNSSYIHLKKKGYHTFLDLYRALRPMSRKYKTIPILVKKDDTFYECRYKYTANGRLILIAGEETDLDSHPVKTRGKKEHGKCEKDKKDKTKEETGKEKAEKAGGTKEEPTGEKNGREKDIKKEQ